MPIDKDIRAWAIGHQKKELLKSSTGNPETDETQDIKVGKRCEHVNSLWRHPIRAAKQAARVLTSAIVPEDVSRARMAICHQCPHSTRYNGRYYCECCGCPKYNLSSLESKNTRAAHQCPAIPPKFGEHNTE